MISNLPSPSISSNPIQHLSPLVVAPTPATGPSVNFEENELAFIVPLVDVFLSTITWFDGAVLPSSIKTRSTLPSPSKSPSAPP